MDTGHNSTDRLCIYCIFKTQNAQINVRRLRESSFNSSLISLLHLQEEHAGLLYYFPSWLFSITEVKF